jgi:hypothetical protein
MKQYKLEVEYADAPLLRIDNPQFLGNVTLPNRVRLHDVLSILRALHPDAKAWSVSNDARDTLNGIRLEKD